MNPVVFGQNRGWLNMPQTGEASRVGVVIFGAYGVEDLSTRQSLAVLAERLAKNGHPVLRFDLPGTGDSLGDWCDSGQLSAWVSAGRAAVDALRDWSGVAAVSLVGLRLGGMVATLVAKELLESDSPVQGLALLGPVLQGRQYIREMRTLADDGPELAVAGFPLSEETQLAISAVDIGQIAYAPAQRIFLGVPGVSKAMTKLQAQWGANAEISSVAYVDMAQHIGNSITSCAPVGMFDSLVAWFAAAPTMNLATRTPVGARWTDPTCKPSAAILRSKGFVEEGVIVDAGVGLAGVWCRPEGHKVPGPVIVFCSPGRNPHVGFARGWVNLARRLAMEGVSSFRFDLAGIGDSPPLSVLPEEVLYSDAGISQLRAVLDAVERATGSHRMCVLGTCSGGYLALHEAVTDVRVAGLVLVNVQCLVWQKGTSFEVASRLNGKSTQVYRQRLFQPQTWMRIVRGQVNVPFVVGTLMRRAGRYGGVLAQQVWGKFLHLVREFGLVTTVTPVTSEARIRQCFATIAARKTETVVLYGDEDVGRDEFARYFGSDGAGYVRLPHTRLRILTNFDHNVTDRGAQNLLFEETLAVYRRVSQRLPDLAQQDMENMVPV
jgi:pimeloyl-ACP methyl ester carboxylesterase